MNAIKEIDQFLTDCISAGDFAGAVYLVAEDEQIRALGALGFAVITPEKHAATIETIFDLASLTKPLLTGMLTAQFVERGLINLSLPVKDVLPEFDIPDKRSITIADLASHSSGLAAWKPLYILAEKPDRILDIIASTPLEYEPGTRVVYSDLGYIALGFLLERVGGKPLDLLARHNIFRPLGLARMRCNPPPEIKLEIAASEIGNQYEKRLAGDLAAKYGHWREEVIWGEVHDQNAYFMGGAAGHAGLFGSAEEIYLTARQFLSGSRLAADSTLELFRENLAKGLEEARSLGWQLASTAATGAGDALPADSFGHAGFTGTSLWISPQERRIYILLTNRTHPAYREFNMNERRRRFHALAQAVFEDGERRTANGERRTTNGK